MTNTNPRTPSPLADPPDRIGPESDQLAERASSLRVASTIAVPDGHDEVTRDVRARRPSLLTALRRGRAPQRLARVASLLALDFGAIWLAIFSALAFKELVRGNYLVRPHQRPDLGVPAVRFPRHRAAVRAQPALLASRGAPRPGGDHGGAVPGHDRVGAVRGRERARVPLLLHLLRRLRVRSRLPGGRALALRARHRTLCWERSAASRRAILVGSGDQIEAVAHALGSQQRRLRDRRLHLADAAARERAAQPRPFGGPAAAARRAPDQRGHHRRPRASRRTRRWSWSTVAASATSPFASRPRRWRS